MPRQFDLRLGEKETVHLLLQWEKGRKTPKWDVGAWDTEIACVQVVPAPVTMGTLVQEKKKKKSSTKSRFRSVSGNSSELGTSETVSFQTKNRRPRA